MDNIDQAKAAELQSESANACALARNAYELAKTEADLDSAAIKQQAAARAYRSAVSAREAVLGIWPALYTRRVWSGDPSTAQEVARRLRQVGLDAHEAMQKSASITIRTYKPTEPLPW